MIIGLTFRLRPFRTPLRAACVCAILAGNLALANPPSLPENLEAPAYVPDEQDLPPPPSSEEIDFTAASDDVPPPPPTRPPPSEPPGEKPPGDSEFEPHPADNDSDRTIDDIELSQFAGAWLRGIHNDDSALSRASQIWIEGGLYTYDANASGVERWRPIHP